MSTIRDRATGVLMTEEVFRTANPSKIFPNILTKEILAANNCDPVFNVAPPAVAFNERAVFDGAVLELNSQGTPTGNWIQQWKKVTLSTNELSTKSELYVAEFEAMVTDMVQRRLDNFAHTRSYGDRYGGNAGISCASYVGSTNPKYHAEAVYYIAKREETWNKVYQIKAQVLAKEIPMPNSYAEIEAMLPVLEWPN